LSDFISRAAGYLKAVDANGPASQCIGVDEQNSPVFVQVTDGLAPAYVVDEPEGLARKLSDVKILRWMNASPGRHSRNAREAMRGYSKFICGTVAAALLGIVAPGAARGGSNAAYTYEQLSAIETVALACQPPSREDRAGFRRNLGAARTDLVRSLQSNGFSAEQAEAEAHRRGEAPKSRIIALIDAEGCDSDKMIPLLRQYFDISEWHPGKGPFPLPPPPPVLSQTTREELLAAAGYKKVGGVWHNDCGRAIDPVFTTVQLAKQDVRQVIVTIADAVCYGQAERRNTVLQRAGAKWTRLVEMVGVLDVGSVVTHGYRELVLGGPGYCGNEIHRWDGRAYNYVCNQTGDIDAGLRHTCTAAPGRIRWCMPDHGARP
jgi:hypothetical protein